MTKSLNIVKIYFKKPPQYLQLKVQDTEGGYNKLNNF